jgi:hypothetical protein
MFELDTGTAPICHMLEVISTYCCRQPLIHFEYKMLTCR